MAVLTSGCAGGAGVVLMVTLSQAFRLCGIDHEIVYLQAVGSRDDFFFAAKKIRNKLDMKKIKVIRIEPKFECFGPDYLGMLFVVRGIDKRALEKLYWKCLQE